MMSRLRQHDKIKVTENMVFIHIFYHQKPGANMNNGVYLSDRGYK